MNTSDPGTAKTRGHLMNYAARRNPGRLLVVCPGTLMRPAWGGDVEKFLPQLTIGYSDAGNREEAFNMGTDIVVINTDGVKWLEENKKHLKGFDHLVIDEISTFKHPTSQRTKAMTKLSKLFEFREGLTGTPTPNSVMELFQPTLILDGGKRLGTSYFKFRNETQTAKQTGPAAQHVTWVDKPGVIEAVQSILADMTIRFEFEAVMTHVPPNYKHVKEFFLAPRAKAIYDRMERDSIARLEDGSVLTSVHAAAMRSKLLQIASGAVYDGGEDSSYKVIDNTRYELVTELIQDRAHSVTFFNWRHQRDELARMLDKKGVTFAVLDGSVAQRERDGIVARFQAGEYQTVLVHPRTGAHGLTLTQADTTIITSPFYEADLLKQGIHRIYRGAQDKVTNTIFVQARGTVDDLVYARLDGKTERMNDMLSAMAERTKQDMKRAAY